MKNLIIISIFLATIFTYGQNTWDGPDNTTGIVYRSGNVGIGTTGSSSYKLDINGSFRNTAFIFSGSYGDLQMRRTIAGDPNYRRALVPDYNSSSGFSQLTINYAGDFTNGVRIQGPQLRIDGNLGIGVSNPTQKLSVNGKILCEEVEVIQDVLPDYVFQKYYTGFSSLKEDYKMPTLEEVEAFIKANYHLPEVPSAAEVKEEGMQLKEMTTILLQKVEELTLYTIEQEKRIKALEAQLNQKR